MPCHYYPLRELLLDQNILRATRLHRIAAEPSMLIYLAPPEALQASFLYP